MKYKEIRPQKGFQDRFVSSSIDIAIGGGAAGVGKGHPLDAEIVTPFGIRRFGDLMVGDIVSGTDGGMQRVIGVFELGERDVYEFTFADGAKSECTLDHLWNVRETRKITKKRKLNGGDYSLDWRVMTAEQIMKWMDKPRRKGVNLAIPLSSAIQFTRSCTATHCPIDPYVLGLLIGDRCITSRNIKLSSVDEEILESFRSITGLELRCNSGCDYRVKGAAGLIDNLKKLGLFGKKSKDKFIPNLYKVRSIDYRISVLQGLMDTDGYVSNDGKLVFTTTSEQLAKDVQWIVRSLGGKATISQESAGYKNKDGEYIQCNDAYDVYINIKESSMLFRLKRKKDRCTDNYNGGDHLLNRRILSYRYVGKKVSRCIAVSNPNSLYLTNDFVVTHNTSASVLSLAYYINNPAYRALYVRKNLGELKGGGSMMEEFQKMYPKEIIARTTMTDNPEVEFISGCKVIMTHMADENPKNINERVKGWQYDFIYLDELTAYQWSTFTYLLSRNRGSSGEKPILRATTNPKKNSWVRRLLDWYVGEDGLINPERDGVVRYMYYAGGSVDDIVWGNSKEEVYAQVKERIDRQMKASKTEYLSPYDFIKSFVFMSGKLGDNKELMKTQPEYAGNLAMAGGVLAEQLLEGNWNVDEQDDAEIPVSREMAESIFYTDSNDIGGRYITADIAMGGEDNMVLLAWYGFHIQDSLVMSGKDLDAPTVIAVIRRFQQKHDVGDFNVIYDSASVGSFVGGYIRGAVAYHSNRSPIGSRGKARYHNLKSQCTEKLIEMIKYGMISVNPEIANRPYRHANIKKPCTFKEELITESTVIRFLPITETGKLRTLEKKEMGRLLGKGRSPDIIDNLIMRMSVDTDFSSFSEPRDIMQPQGQEAFFEDSGITLQQFLEWA